MQQAPSTHRGFGARWVVAAVAVALSAGPSMASAGPSPGASAVPSPAASAVPPLAGPSPGASLDPGLAEWYRPDLFTAPADPLSLAPQLVPRAARTKAIGPAGGAIAAKGPDGTRYRLTIPEGALAVLTAITVTPIRAVDGLPDGVLVDGSLGVQLAPDGLQLGMPATLTIKPHVPIGDVPVVGLGYRGEGADAAVELLEREAGTLSMAVDHFSGYVASYPVDDGEARVIARMLQDNAEWRLRQEIATLVTVYRQRQRLDIPTPELSTVARNYYRDYLEIILKPRVAMAPRGCTEADAALTAFVEYERWRQVAGLGEDPEFIPYGVDWIVPQRLVDVYVRLCFREAHAECVRTGDFPGFIAYVASMFVRAENMLGAEISGEHLDLAHGYLRRCGRYRVVVLSDDIDEDPGDFERRERYGLEIELEWAPGPGAFGIFGSRIDGEAEHGDIDFAFGEAGCRQVISRTRSDRPGHAEIVGLQFDRPFGPTLTGQPIPPQPSKLILVLDLGVIGFHYRCDGPGWTDNEQNTLFGLLAHGLLRRADLQEGVTTVARIGDGWTFSIAPFHAAWRHREPLRAGGRLYSTLVLEVTVEHEPG